MSIRIEGRHLRNYYHVLRHGESVANQQGTIVSGIRRGGYNFGLTQEGYEQVDRTSRKNTFDSSNTVIYSSPFLRCRQTAEKFAQQQGISEVKVVEALGERGFGDFEGTDKDNYVSVYARDADDPENVEHGVESTRGVATRVNDLISNHIEPNHDGQQIVLVTHADPAEILECTLVGLPPHTHRLTVDKLRNAELRRLPQEGRTQKGIGEKLLRSIREEGLASLRAREGLLGLQAIDRVIFFGSSATGKTTLERALRRAAKEDPSLKGKISIPLRVVTRDPRTGDGDDIIYCSNSKFEEMATREEFGLHGIKMMEGGRPERYGLLRPADGTFPVYFGNNGVIKNPGNVCPSGIFKNSLLVALYTPEVERARRLQERSQDLMEEKPEEVAFRLSPEERSIRLAAMANIVVKNFGSYESRVISDTITLIKFLV